MQQRFMRRALQLARRGAGRVSPNPLVGAVLVRHGKIIGEGYHLFGSRDHAEIVALTRAGAGSRGADLYVTLEPCHHQGRTPPCSRVLVGAGIRRIFVAVEDPNPLVSGAGIRFLQASGVEVHVGLLEREATRLNEKFFHFIRHRRPFVLLKLAQTLDGKIAGAGREPGHITGPAARRFSQRLRYEYDAILIGIETLLKDDPSLDVRWRRQNAITKVILDSRLRTPTEARIFDSGDRVLLAHAPSAPRERLQALGERAELLQIPATERGLEIASLLERLGEMEVTSLIVEGGSRVAASFLEASAVQRINFFYAPKILGDLGTSGIGPLAKGRVQDCIELQELRTRRLPPDVLIDAPTKFSDE